MDDIRGLTLIQPWATLIAQGHKQIETRSWSTPYRGPVLIHAGAKTDRAYLGRRDVQALLGIVGIPNSSVVAMADLVACRSTKALRREGLVSDTEELTGDFSPGRYGFVLENIRPVDPPIPAKGALNLWRPAPALISALRTHVSRK